MTNVTEGFRISPQQERVWLLSKEGPAFCGQISVRIAGPLDARLLRASLEESIRRHEILRASFPRRAGTTLPIQVIADEGALDWRSEDLGGMDPGARAARIRDACPRERSAAFDFERGPLFRALLLKLSPQEHALIATLPSLLTDSRGLQILVQDIAGIYAARSAGGEAFDGEPVQYLQFSEWQHALLEGEDGKEGKDYWRARASEKFPAPVLPGERKDAPDAEFDPRRCRSTFDRELVAEIDRVAQRLGSSTEAFLLACWESLLLRLGAESPLAVSAACDGRVYDELRDCLGPFTKWLPLACRFREASKFREVLADVDASLRGAAAWQEYFVSQGGEAPFIAVGFELEERIATCSAGPIELSIEDLYACSEPFKLRLCCIRSGGELVAEIQYDARAVEEGEVEALAARFGVLLRSVLANPEREVSALDILSRAERERLLVEWNRTETGVAERECLDRLFELQAERTPDAIALEFEGQQLTYAELDGRANQLAHHLRKLGTGPEVVVGIHLERSLDLMIGLLGTMKAAGVYLPLDPSYPSAHLAFMLEDARVRVLLTETRLLEGLPPHDGEVVCLDRDWMVIARGGRHAADPRATPDHLAYVIYTSGSTGKPKGAMIPHRGLSNYLDWCTEAYRVSEGTGAPVHSPIGFDLTITGLFSPLLVGRTVTLLPEGQGLESFEAAMQAGRGFSLVKLTPVHLEALGRRLPEEDAASSTRALVIGGDALMKGSLSFWRKHAPRTRLINEYGPTETVVGCCVYEVSDEDDAEGAVPIGRPIANTAAYVLDSHLGPVPARVAGELAIGGAGVGRGYLNRPELTASRFIPDPFGARPGARLYRTGDLACWLPGGNLEFLGRRDRQVKIRGHRIELDEVEAHLSGHPSIRQTAVMAREDASGDKALVAYCVPRDETPSTRELRDFLRARLPHYMVPGVFVMLPSMPITGNGKVDRKALPAPDAVKLQREGSFVAPRSLVEEQLAEIWTKVLRIERVGVHDDFFDLGGHSLLATQLISRLREVFQIELPFDELFERPTIAGLARALEEAEGGALATPPLVRVSREQDLPLSFAQQRLWFLNELVPESPFYNLPLRVRLRGQLDVSALRQTFQEIVRRHESLRTSFATIDGRAIQRIAPFLSLPFSLVDLSSLPASGREAELLRLAGAEAEEVFHLSRAPLMRVRLLQLGDEDFVVLLTLHHILADGWSMGVLLRDLAAIYAAASAGRPPSLPELPVQYADYAHWQRHWLEGEVLHQHLAYYREQLADLPVLDLAWDRPRPAVQTYHGSTHYLQWPGDLSRGLEELRRREGATLFMVLQAAFQTLLSRYSGQTDIVLGSPVANRHRPEIEGLIGFFVNMLVLRGDLGGDPGFRELLGRTRKVCREAMAHQDLPYEKLVEELEPERDLSRQPLFQIVLALENAPSPPVEVSEALTLELMEVETRTSKFDLGLSVWERTDGLGGCIEYNTDLIDGVTMRRLAAHFETLLWAIVRAPDERLSMLRLLREAECQQLLLDWNDVAAEYSAEACAHERFEVLSDRTPDAVAVIEGDRRLTYGALNGRANQLARHLRLLGVGPETRVGICMERSLETVVGMLGALKAGGAYVPLDPDSPPDRLAFMIQDATLPVLLTQGRIAERLPATEAHRLCLDEDWDRVALQSTANPDRRAVADNLCYVIYTSGSTGKPKGVSISHRALCNHMSWMLEDFPLEEHDRILQRTSSSFDASVWEFWAPLLAGSQLVLAEPGARWDAESLIETIVEQHVTTVQFVPSLLQLFLDTPGVEDCRCLKRIFTGGEALTAALARRCFDALPASLHNLYGPTETTIEAVVWSCEPGRDPGVVPIGRPIANARVYVMDRDLRPVPIGVPGELGIGGPGVARGYLHRPALTAEKFIPSTLDHEGARLYRTGDLCRWLPDGNLQFLGRTDHQVRVRGYRVELGEIETALAQHPGVKHAVVLSREDVPGDRRLVGYVVLDSGAPEAAAELRSHLQARLPDYMVPAIFVTLDAMPLNASGKVDRKLLPAPEGARPDLASAYTEPRTPVEAELARIWSAVLQVERVGIHDDFFDLGGHSLLATSIVSRIRQAFQVEIPLRRMFETPTIFGLARAIDAARPGLAAPPLRAVDRSRELPLSFAQQRLWFVDQMVPGSPFFNVPFAVRVEGDLDVEVLEGGLNEIVRRHEALRTTFASRDGAPRQRIAPSLTLQIAVVEVAELPEADREFEALRLAQREAERPFDLERGPLLRAGVIRLGAADHIVLLTLHHIVSDEWSTRLLFQELLTLYEAALERRPSPLPELSIQYADFAHWQRQWLSGDVLEEQLSYWKERLAGLPILALPTDRPRPAQMTFRGAVHSMTLPLALTASLRALTRREGMTLFMTLLAGFQVLLSRYARQDDVVVGAPIANRNRSEIESLIGFFVNTLVLRADLSGNPSFRDVLGRVKEASLGAFVHQEVPFDLLVERLSPERHLSHTPLFQVAFAMESEARGTVAPPRGLRLTPLDLSRRTSKCDLTLFAWEGTEGIACTFEYSTDLFDAPTVTRMAEHYRILLERMVEDPDARIDEPIITDDERDRLIRQSRESTGRDLDVEEWTL
jgi:amino acid adenylation domain-containing protein